MFYLLLVRLGHCRLAFISARCPLRRPFNSATRASFFSLPSRHRYLPPCLLARARHARGSMWFSMIATAVSVRRATRNGCSFVNSRTGGYYDFHRALLLTGCVINRLRIRSSIDNPPARRILLRIFHRKYFPVASRNAGRALCPRVLYFAPLPPPTSLSPLCARTILR